MSRIGKSDITIQLQNEFSAARMQRTEQEKSSGKKDGQKDTVIFAGNLLPGDRIAARKKQLQERAMKVVMDQFERDSATDAVLAEKRKHIADLKEAAAQTDEQLRDVKAAQEHLIDQAGISEEELALMRKARKGGLMALNEEEQQQFLEMGGLSEEQSSILAYDDVIDYYRQELDSTLGQIAGEARSIEGIKGALVKQHGMTDAFQTKEEMSLEAAKEVAGMLFEEAKEKLEKEWQEMLEKAQEAAEKKEEKEELLEKAAENKEQKQETAEEISENVQKDVQEVLEITDQQDKVKLEMDKLLQETGMLEEELKGILIDQQM